LFHHQLSLLRFQQPLYFLLTYINIIKLYKSYRKEKAPMMIDDITSLKRDAFVYTELIQEFSKRNHKIVSRYVTKKLCANFAEDSRHVPILKYSSIIACGTGVFGGDAIVRMKSVLKKDIQLDKMLESTQSQGHMPFYDLNELVDVVTFKEWLDIYSKLKPFQIAWLATHRSRKHTHGCVSYNWTLWRFHIQRIFARVRAIKLLDNPHLAGHLDDAEKAFIEKEIDEAARNARQALEKIQSRDVARHRVIQWMDVLAKAYPIAVQIKQTIEPPFKINPQIILMAKIRRCFTTILRLRLTNLGLTFDGRTLKRSMECYLYRLKNYFLQLGDNWKQWAEAIENTLQSEVRQSGLKELHELFRRISVIEDYKCWYDDKQLALDQWVKKQDQPQSRKC